MGKTYDALTPDLIQFISAQKLFFVGTAPLSEEGHVNISPKGMDSVKVLDNRTIAYLDVTGSGVETISHIKENGRLVFMFCAFEGPPMILRLYGTARAVHEWDADWGTLYDNFEPMTGARQVYDMQVDLVQTSCGFAVPTYHYEGQREVLDNWADKRGKDMKRQTLLAEPARRP